MPARFEVHHVFEVTRRGRVVAGTILSGEFRIGTRLWAEHMPSLVFTIAAIEYVDNITPPQSWVAFVSTDTLGLDELREALPAGSILSDTPPGVGSAEVPHVA